MPRGNTPPNPDVKIGVPCGTIWRYGTPCSSNSHTPGPSVPWGATMPYTLPSAAIALARNSRFAHVTTMLVRASTVDTRPMSPSGLTTAASGRTPWSRPADTTSARGSVGAAWWSTSAGT